jgi:hypothetical protein
VKNADYQDSLVGFLITSYQVRVDGRKNVKNEDY